MATRCVIHNQMTGRVAYCHYDGYPEGVGCELDRHFNADSLADGITSMGDLHSIRNGVPAVSEHFETPTMSLTQLLEVAESCYCAEYAYSWDGTRWQQFSRYKPWAEIGAFRSEVADIPVSDDRGSVRGIILYRYGLKEGTAIPPEGDSIDCWTDIVAPVQYDAKAFYDQIALLAQEGIATTFSMKHVPTPVDITRTFEADGIEEFCDRLEANLEARFDNGTVTAGDKSIRIRVDVYATPYLARGMVESVLQDLLDFWTRKGADGVTHDA
jgi:hypothetical protein